MSSDYRALPDGHPADVLTLTGGALPEPFTAIADRLQPIMWLMDSEQRVLWVNRNAYSYFDIPEDALLDDRWSAVVADADIPRYREIIDAAKTQQLPAVHSITVRGRGQTARRLTVCLTPVAISHDRSGLLGIAIDTTDQQAAWAEATRKASVVDVLMALLTEGVVLHGPDGTIDFANAAAEEILGLPSSVMTGTHSRDTIWEVRDAAFDPFPGDQHPAQVTLRTGEAQRDVLMAVYRGASRESASWRWLSVNSRAVPNVPPRGDRSVLVTFTDVTEARAHEDRRVLLAREEEARRGAQAAARRASLLADALRSIVINLEGARAPDELLALLVPDLADSCWVVRRDPATGALTSFGSICRYDDEAVTGAPGSVIPSDLLDSAHPLAVAIREDRAVVIPTVGDQWRAWPSFTLPRRHDGQECHPLSVVVQPVRGSHAVLGAIMLTTTLDSTRTLDPDDAAMVRDIADRLGLAIENARLIQSLNAEVAVRRLAEQRLADRQTMLTSLVEERTRELTELNEQLRRSLRLKDEFLASMSHELRTPLNAVLGTAELMAAGLSGPLTETQVEDLHIIEQSGRHLLSLINDILDLAKIGSGTLRVSVSTFDASEMVRNSLQLLSSSFAQKSLTLSPVLPDAPIMITSDQRMLAQILFNLLSNAIKFTDAGGRITVSLCHDVDRDRLVLAVEDTGVGIRPEDLHRLFQPFEQLDGSLARAQQGTGLGLSLVARMVDLINGHVRLTSVPGEGSSFTVTIPTNLSSTAQLMAANAPPLARPTTAATILVADDNMANRRTCRAFLQAHGFTVHEAQNGIEAITSCGTQRPDLIIIDMQMPKMDGPTAIEILRRNAAFASTPIVAVTALAIPGDRERILDGGANAYLAKPIRLHELLAVIRELLASQPVSK